ncbi:MAG TPA: M13 family metallopeptidase, partial [Thermoanaerobaculia bacterium]|nr:M13 family metallopeptidase [Thermoanaerobaculia bacterium]
GAFYASCIDEAAIERAGLSPLQPAFDRIAQLQSPRDFAPLVAALHHEGVAAPFGFGSTQDARQADQVVAGIAQAGLGLPDRDYYTKDDDRSKEIRARYVQHIAKMLQLAGSSAADAAKSAANIMALETSLAEAQMTNVELRDPTSLYNKLTRAQLDALTPNFSWPSFLAPIGQDSLPSIIVAQPKYLTRANELIASTPAATWRDYFRWHLLNNSASTLPKQFVETDFDFYGRFLEGKKEMLPRWERCANATDTMMGEAVGQLWTDRYFPAASKAAALQMVHNLIDALHSDIQTLDWMSPATQQQAIAKLQAYALKIGYPDKWRDYSALQVGNAPYATNVLAAQAFEFNRSIGKIGKPLDRTEWLMSPPTVNAYNNPPMNEIVFPAGILQPPFYSPTADDAYNYGGMGAVIGHEMTHGFDDEGRQYDLKGNLADWWTSADAEKFKQRAQCVIDQFSAYDALNGQHMTGELVVGESIADLGGLAIAYAAYQKSQQGKTPQIIDGFTPEQRFFLGWAQVWASNDTPEAARLQITTDPHPLSRFRVNGPLSNLPQFAAAYGCKSGDPMVRATQCNIW